MKKSRAIPVSPLHPRTDEQGWLAVQQIISKADLAKGLGIKKQNLTRWKKVPPHHVPRVAELTGLSREQILPSIYSA